MKHLYLLFYLLAFPFISCKTTRNYLLRSDEDKTLFDIVKRLNKSPGDTSALNALPVVYELVQKRHLGNINSYTRNQNPAGWDKTINEYESLQKIHDAIVSTPVASRIVTPVSYTSELNAARQEAAEENYHEGLTLLAVPGRENAKEAYGFFKKSIKYVPGYKDSKARMDQAFQNAIINVVINPIQDRSYFFNSGYGNSGFNYNGQQFQQTLVRELGGAYSSRYPARFYTDWEAQQNNIRADWVIEPTLRNLDIPRPSVYNYTRNASQQIEAGRDTSGRPVYHTVYATLNISRQSFTARGILDLNVVELSTRKNISYNSFSENYDWQEEYASYTGDSRALSSSDWSLINNRQYDTPEKDDIMNELFRRFYPQVRNKISYLVAW